MDMEVQRCISSTQSVAEQFDVIKLSVQAISELTACMIESLRISNSLQFQDEEDRKAIHLAGYKID